ncbi:MAG: response regulator [SAR324 cluster bacterium]|nr:response regulator [SAR324 cluster bacterium]
MKSTIIDLNHYRGQSTTLEIALEILSNWDSQKPSEQLTRDQNRIRRLLPSLFQELSDKEMEVKSKVFTLLGKAAIPNAAAFLVSYLNDIELEIRESVIGALGLLQDPIAILPLKNAYTNESAELRPQIIQSLLQLVNDQFFFQLLGKDPNLNKITIALELLDMLASESNLLLSPEGFRSFLDQIVPHFQNLRRSAFDVKILKQTIQSLQEDLHHNLEQSESSLETMKFQLKIQHTQLQSFLEFNNDPALSEDELEVTPILADSQDAFEAEADIEQQTELLTGPGDASPKIHPLMETLTKSVESLASRLDEVTQKLEQLPAESSDSEVHDAFPAALEETGGEITEEADEEQGVGTVDEIAADFTEEAVEEEPEFDPNLLTLELTDNDQELIQGLFGTEIQQPAAPDNPPLEGSIFVLDDNPLMLKNIEGLMQYTGFSEVKTFSNPMQALKEYKAEHENLVLIASDWKMPVMDGREFMKAVRDFEKEESLTACPIIFITDETNIYQIQILLEEGAQRVIPKPFVPDELIQVVKEITGVDQQGDGSISFLDLKALLLQANRNAFVENKKNVKKKLKYRKNLQINSKIEEDLEQCLTLIISVANVLSLPGHSVLMNVDQSENDESAAVVILEGTTDYCSESEVKQEVKAEESKDSGDFLSELQNLIGTDSADGFSLAGLLNQDKPVADTAESPEPENKGWSLKSFVAAHSEYEQLFNYVDKVEGRLDCELENGKFSLNLSFSWSMEEEEPQLVLDKAEELPDAVDGDDEVEAFQYLVDLEEDGEVEATIRDLEKLCAREPTQIFHVVDYLHDGHFERASREILEMFHRLNRIDVIPYLIRRFPHLHKEFKLWTLSFIAEHDIRYGFFFIISVLRDQDKDVRHRAMAVLVEHFDMRFLPLMIHSLKHTFNMPKGLEENAFLRNLPDRERSAVLSILLFSSDFEQSVPMLLGYLDVADPYECEQVYKSLGHQESLKYLDQTQITVLTQHLENEKILEQFPRLALQLLRSSSTELLTWLLGRIHHERWKDVFKARFISDIKTAWEAVSDFLGEGIEEILKNLQSANAITQKELLMQEDGEELYRLFHTSKGVALSLDMEILGALYHHLENLLKDILPITAPEDWPEHHDFIEKVTSTLEVSEVAHSILARAFKNDTFLKKAIFVHYLFPRLEQLAHKLGTMLQKNLEIHFLEENTLQVDSSLFQILNNCLIQFIKNCIDHGIELPEERLRQNKPEKATVNVRISTQDKTARILIEDDGAGLDTDKILEKAVDRNILTSEEAVQIKNDPNRRKEIFALVFSSQLSTAKSASMVSGRGVGMDIVRSEIKKLGGSIECESERGKGSSFCVILPFQMPDHVIVEVEY